MNRIHMTPFEYFEPETLEEVSDLLLKYGKKARIMAGGIDLIPRIRQGSVETEQLISIQGLKELGYFSFDAGKGLDFGAMTTLHELELSDILKDVYPELHKAIHQITSTQTKCMGTAVGNIALATPATDVGPAMMAYDAELIIYGPEGERREAVSDFYVDYLVSSLKPGEFITGVHIPVPEEGTGARFINRNRTHGDIAKISVTCLLTIQDNVCTKARIGLGSVAPVAFRAKEAEAILEGKSIDEDILIRASEVVQENLHPITDIRSTADYRLDVTRVLVERALISAWEKAIGGEDK